MLVASGAAVFGISGMLEAASTVQAWPKDWPTRRAPLIADGKVNIVKMYAELSLRHLTETSSHWGIGCSTGRFADECILVSPAEPVDFHDAMARIGAKAGNNLASDSYGQFVAGDLLNVTVSWPGLRRPFDISEIFLDSTGKGYQIRFGGNRPAAEKMRTGCLTCLESCPIAITSNAAYPHIRSIKRKIAPNSRFRGNPETLPRKEAFPMTVFYRLSGGTDR
jgi:hypothetical protein